MASSLDSLGIRFGTDKSSLNHGYLRHYERIVQAHRERPVTLLEIGVFRGASLAAWEEFFEQGTIVGVDINPACAQFAGGRRHVEIGSQADRAVLVSLMDRWQPHIVIDDGSHLADHVIFTFETVFPRLRGGGVYIIEDLHFHAGGGAPHWRNGSKRAPQDLLLEVARRVTCPESEGDDGRHLAVLIDSIEFFYGGVAIRRKEPFDRGAMETRRLEVQAANRPETWAAFAVHSYNNTGDLEDALLSIKTAIDAEPKNAGHWDIRSSILEKAGLTAAACEAAAMASELDPQNSRLRDRAVRLKRNGGDHGPNM